METVKTGASVLLFASVFSAFGAVEVSTTSALLKAIEDAPSDAVTEIRLAAGDYGVDHELVVEKPVHIVGPGWRTTSIFRDYKESFRVMKSQLDARPVYLQKEDTITGHFLICYLSVLLTRLLQFKVLDNAYCSECIFDFLRDFRVVQASDTLYINLSRTSVFLQNFSSLTGLPLASYYLNNTQIHSILSHRF